MDDEKIIKIALDLNLNDILQYCSQNLKINKLICNNQNFWKEKMYKDYFHILNLSLYGKNYKEIYINLSKNIEIFLNIIIIQRYYEDDEEIIKEINLEKLLKFSSLTTIDEIIEYLNDKLTIFSKKIVGDYNVFIDGSLVCKNVINLKGCFQLNDETKEILIYLYTKEDIDLNKEKEYQKYLD